MVVEVRDGQLREEEDGVHLGEIAGRPSLSDVVRRNLGPVEEVSFPARGESRGAKSEKRPQSLLERLVVKAPW